MTLAGKIALAVFVTLVVVGAVFTIAVLATTRRRAPVYERTTDGSLILIPPT